MIRLSGRKRKKSLPDWWNRYAEMNTSSINPHASLDSLVFSVIDIESSGLDPDRDSMVSFAGLRIRNKRIQIGDSIEITINPDDDDRDRSVHIHELTQRDKNLGALPENALQDIIQYIGNTVLVGFHVQFDYRFINRALDKYLGVNLLNPSVDIDHLAGRIDDPVHRVHPVIKRDLSGQCKQYGIESTDPHTAAGDVFASAQLFLKMMVALEKRGITSWRKLKKK